MPNGLVNVDGQVFFDEVKIDVEWLSAASKVAREEQEDPVEYVKRAWITAKPDSPLEKLRDFCKNRTMALNRLAKPTERQVTKRRLLAHPDIQQRCDELGERDRISKAYGIYVAPKERKCLRCENKFLSRYGNRTCGECQDYNKTYAGGNYGTPV